MKKIIKFLDEKLEEWILILSFMFLVVLVFAQVFFRYVISESLGWSEELSRYMLIWIAWISACYIMRSGKHIRIETIKNKFSESVQKWIEALVLILWSIFALFLAIEGMDLVLGIQATGQVSPSIGIPMWMVYLGLPIGGVIMIIRIIQQFYWLFTSKQKGGAAE